MHTLAHDPDEIALAVLDVYSGLSFKPPDGKFTILAAFVLRNALSRELKVISLGSGSKCLPEIRLCKEGYVVHDSHAEIIARRGAVRWLMEEIHRYTITGFSDWVEQLSSGRFALKSYTQVTLYASTVPCGDASMRYLASFQDAEMAALKNSTEFPVLPPGTASRGRDNYSLFGVLRTKPGRADSPPTLCMCCSDKIASWNVTGFQGALASHFLEPIYVDNIIIGDVEDSLRDVVLEDCDRAFWNRLDKLDESQLPTGFSLRKPQTHFTNVLFLHSSLALGAKSSCNDSLCYSADCSPAHEILINGIRRGVPPKRRHNPKFRPVLSKLSLFNLYSQMAGALDVRADFHTYREAKESSQDYQAAKAALRGTRGPFAGWITTGSQWEYFDMNGDPQGSKAVSSDNQDKGLTSTR